MKKTYIKPEITIVVLGIEKIICNSIPERGDSPIDPGDGNGTPDIGGGDNLAREIIQSRDAWEDW